MKSILIIIIIWFISSVCIGQTVKNDILKGRKYVEINPIIIGENQTSLQRLYCLGIAKDSINPNDRYIYLSWSLTDLDGLVNSIVGSVTMDVSDVPSALEVMNVNQTIYMFQYIIMSDSSLKNVVIK